MLVDEDNADIFAVLGELVKRCLDGRCVGLAVNYKEVLLRIRARRDMLPRLLAFS